MTFRRLASTGYIVGLVVGLGLLALYGAMEASSTPRFCGSCHVMTPYYESWTTSSHAGIACVDCHIPPGVSATLRKKYEALSMVTSYFTGSYGSRPWAEVEDAACLECHERRLLVGRELYGDILFDHAPHLTELRRGKRLQCTSCHAQIVQGSHITVTPTTCILCHFKGEQPGTGTARCRLCHQLPEKIVDVGGFEFDHADVGRFGMGCEACHEPVSASAGGVPRERCRTCHNDPARLSEYDHSDKLHEIHVTEHKVECTHCHLEIEHVAPRHIEATGTECSACHVGGHSAQRNLYAGVGGNAVQPMPDVMYRAGVRCEGCHSGVDGGHTRGAGAVACMSCHGPKYRALFERWKTLVDGRTATVRRALDDTAGLLGEAATDALAASRANLELVEHGGAIHNVPYSLALLLSAHEQLNDARKSHGADALPAPWRSVAYESPCLACHIDVGSATTTAFGRPFDHGPHVLDGAIDCQACHTTHEEREVADVGPLRFGAAGCDSCHHGDESRDCRSCHMEIEKNTYPVERGDFEHAFHVDMMQIACSDCHGDGPNFTRSADPEACSVCH